jgi:epoxyqueuosine reductase
LSTSMTDRQKIETEAKRQGFDLFAVAEAAVLGPEGERLDEWLRRGYQATMGWMERTAAKRKDPGLLLRDARSVIVVAMNYYVPVAHGTAAGKVSRYAWGEDYHTTMEVRLRALLQWLEEHFEGCQGICSVDAGPVMDKVWAQRAGMGWIGKHSNVITRTHGSWVFLGEILTTLQLQPDAPAVDHCGTCTLCIEACPTDAIVEPYVVDGGKCISYLTIEHRGPIEEERQKLDGWIFGCDICQDVCPWNHRFSRATEEPAYKPRPGFVTPELKTWRALTPEQFREKFQGSAIRRAKQEGLQRNIDIVLRADSGEHIPASHVNGGKAPFAP